MTALLDASLRHLAALVAFDTRNPPRAINHDGIFAYLRAQLGGFRLHLRDHGAGAISLYAVRGTPRLLFNVHIDTVPDSPAWSRDPHTLHVADGRAIGLGACDIKGAAAALLAVAQASNGPMALLFSSDEEANDARCIAGFLADLATADAAIQPPEAVIVAEPTDGRAVLAHRGIQSLQVGFAGVAGHASAAQQAGDNAVHQALHWGHAALAFAAAQEHTRFAGLRGLRCNIGTMEGGIKGNMTAPSASLQCSLRPLPNMDPDALLGHLRALTAPPPARLVERFRGPSLPARDAAGAAARHHAAQTLAEALGLSLGEAVDFWTEAALFSAAGYTALVCGPGHIAQAHAADEWLALDSLAAYAHTLHRIVDHGNA